MPQEPNIYYLPHNQINKASWDSCIDSSTNGLIYGYSYYLDHMADNWDALVWNDYEAVMPLPWRKKFGLLYLYQPFLAAQLGLFGKDVNAGLLKSFLDSIPSKFKLWEFSLNHGNVFEIENYGLYHRKNYILDLDASYEKLFGQFRDNIKRNIRKSGQYGSYIDNDIEINEVIRLHTSVNGSSAVNDPERFAQLFRKLKSENRAKAYGVYSKQDQLIASAAFLFSHNRAYYILVGNHPNGRTLGASHALLNEFIRDYSDKSMVLDFEGSDIPNLAFFYSSFGAIEEDYVAIRENRLPWYARLFKR